MLSLRCDIKTILIMATSDLRLSKKIGGDGKAQVIVKLTINRSSRPCFKSGVFINPDWFKPVKETKKGMVMGIVPPKKGKYNQQEVADANSAKSEIDDFTGRLKAVCKALEEHGDDVNHDAIVEAVRLTMGIPVRGISYKAIQASKDAETKKDSHGDMTFFDWYNKFITERGKDLSKGRVQRFAVMGRMLGRYESFVRLTDRERKDFHLDIDTMDKDTLEDFFDYLANEKSLSEEYPAIFERLVMENPVCQGKRKQVIGERGRNVIVYLKKVLKAFFNWLNKEEITDNRPFNKFDMGREHYARPYYLTLEERNIIAEFDMDERWESMTGEDKKKLKLSFPTLKAQRDIFIFQCLIGCRVADLLTMTPSNIDNEILSYIPRKTRKQKPDSVRVPLNQRAKALVEKYQGVDRKGRLFPFISSQKYNDAIKDVIWLCGVDRMITKLNSVTGEEEQHPIWAVASSHMARRTFVGNLYKKLKDPKLVGSLSGHSENSNAFARYREIDDDIKKEVVALID